MHSHSHDAISVQIYITQKYEKITVNLFWLNDLSVFENRLFCFFLNVCLIEQLYCYKFCMFICYACSVDFYSLVERGKKPNRFLSHFKSARLHVHKAYFLSVNSLIWKYFLINCYISNHSLGHIRLFFNSHDFLIAYFTKSLLFFLLHCIKFKCLFPLLTSYRSLLSNWFALAAQISLNRDS